MQDEHVALVQDEREAGTQDRQLDVGRQGVSCRIDVELGAVTGTQLANSIPRDADAVLGGRRSRTMGTNSHIGGRSALGFDQRPQLEIGLEEKSKGAVPRIFAVLGTFAGVGIIQLPVAQLSLQMQIVAAVLIGVGSLSSFLVLSRLGKSFSIMPEARKLVTSGPYAHARHPLYAVEMITVIGTALQFAAPWSWALALLVVTLLWIRSHFEEQVLADTYPEYAAYRAKTARFIPGVI